MYAWISMMSMPKCFMDFGVDWISYANWSVFISTPASCVIMRRALTLQCAICKCNSVVGLLWIQGRTGREICKRSNILTFYISLQTTTYWDISTILPTFNVEIFPASVSFKLLSLFVHVFYIITYKPNYPIPMLHNQWLHRSMTLFFCDIWVFLISVQFRKI